MCTHTGPNGGRLPCTNTTPGHDETSPGDHTYELGTHEHDPNGDHR